MNRKGLLINHLRKLDYRLMEDDVYNIANNLREYDDDLILFFNPKGERYEVHSCTFFPSKKATYCVMLVILVFAPGCLHMISA